MDETSDSPLVVTLGYRHFQACGRATHSGRATRSSSPRPLRMGERVRLMFDAIGFFADQPQRKGNSVVPESRTIASPSD